MFRGLINDATSAVGAVVAKYAVRASVAVPFIVAIAFATAAVTLMLVERFGHRDAYFIMAAGFVIVGVLASLIVRSKEHDDLVLHEKTTSPDTAEVASDAAAAAAAQMPLALLGALFSGPLGPSTIASFARVLGRNLPLVTLLIAIAFVVWPNEAPAAEEDAGGANTTPCKPNGIYPTVDVRQAAAGTR